jgi:DNA-binding Lrp family transcriptional regulator
MEELKMLANHKEDTLLTLRTCARGFPMALARALEIPRSTARHRIHALEEEGIVTGYTPVVTPQTFGSPYLIQIDINPADYKINTDLHDTVIALKEFFNTGIGHAPLSFYIFKDSECDLLRVHCLTMTFKINQIIDDIYHKQNIARENICYTVLEEAGGVPNYSKFSLRQEE